MQKQNKLIQRITYVFGIGMAAIMVLSLFLPSLVPQTTVLQEAPPTNTPAPPTFPAPIRDLDSIVIGQDYLHPSGVFAVGVPEGWSVNTNVNDTQRLQTNLENQDVVGKIQIGLENPTEPITTIDELNNYYTQSRLQQVWVTDYASWSELGRPSTDDRLIINFRLRDRQNRSFLAQQLAYVQDGNIHFTRVVMPDNAQDALFHLANLMDGQLKINEQFSDVAFGWTASYDALSQWVLRYPRSWIRTDGGDGLPTTIRADNGLNIRIETLTETTFDESSAQSFVEDRFNSAEIVSIEPIERIGGSGFSIAYEAQDFDGETVSGAVVVLNGDNGSAFVASTSIPEAGININDEATTTNYSDLVQVLGSFSLLTNLNLPEPTPRAVPTLFPTPAPAVEATPEETETTEEEATPAETEEATEEDSE
jgi:hypothetical protein